MTKVYLTNYTGYAVIDDEDWPIVQGHSWCVADSSGKRPYAHAFIRGRHVYLHHYVLGIYDPSTDFPVDHINGHSLDCRKENLRRITKSENSQGTLRTSLDKSSKYVGVYRCKQTSKWKVRVSKNKIHYNGGRHLNEDDAARAYNDLAIKVFGPLAKLNKIEENSLV